MAELAAVSPVSTGQWEEAGISDPDQSWEREEERPKKKLHT